MHEASPQTVGIRLENLKPEVRSYVQKLRASLQVVYDRYDVSNRDELAVKVRKGIVKQEDIDKAIELLTVINDCGRKNEIMGLDFERQLIEHERQKLKVFFGREIEVPPLPKGITPEHIAEWKEKCLELHYLPDKDMANEQDLKNWKKPIFPYVMSSDKSKISWRLPGCWVLVDARAVPEYHDAEQMYEKDEDFLGPVLEELRGKHVIGPSKFDRFSRPPKFPQTRFEVSAEDLKRPEMITAICQASGLRAENIYPRMIEFNVLSNIHYPEWMKVKCSEWVSDKVKDGQSLIVGKTEKGDFTVHDQPSDLRNVGIGFRVLWRL